MDPDLARIAYFHYMDHCVSLMVYILKFLPPYFSLSLQVIDFKLWHIDP